jgi:hypothetical protein
MVVLGIELYGIVWYVCVIVECIQVQGMVSVIVWYGGVRYCIVLYGTVLYGIVLYCILLYGMYV